MIPTYLSVFLFVDVLFAATGGLLIAVVVISRHAMSAPTMENVAPNLLLAHAPLNGEPAPSRSFTGVCGPDMISQRCPSRCQLNLLNLCDFGTGLDPE